MRGRVLVSILEEQLRQERIQRNKTRFLRSLSADERKIFKKRVHLARKRIATKEFCRLCDEHTHCPTCGVHMRIDASHINWEEVRGYSSDPCDDCCCGACGSRKCYPGQCHC